jgi:hypothetical protein
MPDYLSSIDIMIMINELECTWTEVVVVYVLYYIGIGLRGLTKYY